MDEPRFWRLAMPTPVASKRQELTFSNIDYPSELAYPLLPSGERRFEPVPPRFTPPQRPRMSSMNWSTEESPRFAKVPPQRPFHSARF